MLAGFILIVLLLGGAAVRSWLVIEGLVEQSRQRGETALQVAALIQELAERTVDVERSARQSLVLEEPAFRERFDENLALALAVVGRLNGFAIAPIQSMLGAWHQGAEALRDGVEKKVGRDELAARLAHLSELNDEVRRSGQDWIKMQNSLVIDQLEVYRLRLGMQILIALAGSLLVAMAMGWWLVRPIRQLEQAITRLGEKRFEEAVAVERTGRPPSAWPTPGLAAPAAGRTGERPRARIAPRIA